MRIIYTALFYLAIPFILLRLYWRGRRLSEYRNRWAERFGFCSFQLKNSIWVHAVSVGETIAAVPLIRALKQQYPDIPIVVTNMTVAGAERVQHIFGNEVVHTYIPYDIPAAVKRFLNHAKPMIGIIMETELWPNLFSVCQQRSIPIVIANARLSEKSMKGYQRVLFFTKSILAKVHTVCAQSNVDAERFIKLGLAKEKIQITGNLKFDLTIPDSVLEKGAALRMECGSHRFVWVAASTHPTEEEIILSAHRHLLHSQPDALLILVPRHPDRFAEVAELCEKEKWNFARRSQQANIASQTQVYLADTMGELLMLYAAADVAFVAGSFANIGGHNMLEPAALEKPILSGPVLFNFAEISELLLKNGGMKLVHNGIELIETLQLLANNISERKKTGAAAYQVVAMNRGALAKHMDIIRSILKDNEN